MASVDAEAPSVMLVEDDPSIAALVELYLKDAGFRVNHATQGERALQHIRARPPKLVILDIGLEGEIDGFEVCRRLRATSDLPIVLLTARDAEDDRLLGLELGADDYITKPFSPRELVARVKAILRRADPARADASPVLAVGEVEVDAARREARSRGTPVALATREFDLLQFLAENRGIALSRQQLLDGVWGVGWEGDDRTVDVHVRQLRKKLGDGLPLATVWGVGYRLG